MQRSAAALRPVGRQRALVVILFKFWKQYDQISIILTFR
jgi:hypothetical protein